MVTVSTLCFFDVFQTTTVAAVVNINQKYVFDNGSKNIKSFCEIGVSIVLTLIQINPPPLLSSLQVS